MNYGGKDRSSEQGGESCIKAAAAKSLQSCPTLCDPVDWSGLPFPSPTHESEK